MLRATLVSDDGCLCIVGITDENVVRMKAGMPLDINLDEMTPPGRRLNRLVINLAHTYEQCVDEMEESDIEIPDHFRETAKKLDAEIKSTQMP